MKLLEQKICDNEAKENISKKQEVNQLVKHQKEVELKNEKVKKCFKTTFSNLFFKNLFSLKFFLNRFIFSKFFDIFNRFQIFLKIFEF